MKITFDQCYKSKQNVDCIYCLWSVKCIHNIIRISRLIILLPFIFSRWALQIYQFSSVNKFLQFPIIIDKFMHSTSDMLTFITMPLLLCHLNKIVKIYTSHYIRYYNLQWEGLLKNLFILIKIENGNGECVKETTMEPKSR